MSLKDVAYMCFSTDGLNNSYTCKSKPASSILAVHILFRGKLHTFRFMAGDHEAAKELWGLEESEETHNVHEVTAWIQKELRMASAVIVSSNKKWVAPLSNLYSIGLMPTPVVDFSGIVALKDIEPMTAFWAYNARTVNRASREIPFQSTRLIIQEEVAKLTGKPYYEAQLLAMQAYLTNM